MKAHIAADHLRPVGQCLKCGSPEWEGPVWDEDDDCLLWASPCGFALATLTVSQMEEQNAIGREELSPMSVTYWKAWN